MKETRDMGHWEIDFGRRFHYHLWKITINAPMNLPNSSSWNKFDIESRIKEMLIEFQQKVHEEFAWVYEEWNDYERYYEEEE